MAYLWQWKSGGEIYHEIRPQIPVGYLPCVHDELAPAEDPRVRGDEGGPELHDDVEEVEEVGDGAEHRDQDLEVGVGGEAGGAAHHGEEEVEWVDEEGDEAGQEEDVVPEGDNVAVGLEDLVVP